MKKIYALKIVIISLVVLLVLPQQTNANDSNYAVEPDPASCTMTCFACRCNVPIESNHQKIQRLMSRLFQEHKKWMRNTYFMENILPALMQMTNQMTNVAMQQMKILGTFFDAKHQLETQRLFQQLMAEAHKDYQPSEGMCDFGTNVRGLVTANRKADLVQQALANRVMDRQLRTGETTAMRSNSDLYSRVDTFKNHFCSKKDNADGLNNICAGVTAPTATVNKDVDYTRAVETDLTLDLDFTELGAALTSDERVAFALMSNLFANDVLPTIGERVLSDQNGNPRLASFRYLDLRSVAAKRSVATNSISAILGERASGDVVTEYAPFLRSVIVELGIPAEGVNYVLGVNPSYFAQMEILTKQLYQNPVFYTELYDKPTNVLRKRAAIRAINLIQDRDFYKSLLRTESVLSVLLESMLNEEQDRVYAHLNRLKPNGEAAHE